MWNHDCLLSLQCFCRGCNHFPSDHDRTTSVRHDGRTLHVGDRVRCYFLMPNRTMLTITRTSNWVVLNAILWPSLLFIAGFVGLFFSCVLLQEDIAKCLQKKEARERALAINAS